MRVLFVGDVFGRPGRLAINGHLPRLKRSLSPDVIIANCENIAGGAGLTIDICRDIFHLGVDVITTGNHVWDRREIIKFIPDEPRLLRPANYPEGTPGHGSFTLADRDMTVLNIQGRVFMRALDDPFRTADALLEGCTSRFVILDFHAEATAEKKALGFYLDGRVSAVLGTHTHVQTADEQILPKGTGFISDVGMTGPIHSIIGNEPDSTLQRYITQMPVSSQPGTGTAEFCAVFLDLDDATGKTVEITRIREVWPVESYAPDRDATS
jgi:metallophosphoesterase (TIGR00282 family)